MLFRVVRRPATWRAEMVCGVSLQANCALPKLAPMTSSPFHLSLRWRRRILRAYELVLCGLLVALGLAAAWPA
ncbi:MAG: hypothetical protein JWP65_3856 [Ramlibacter sp.]|jgi:hypothetical protein|nr:hypothetical protein [Ramlibacter sp.]